jgi:hypothetical protein
MSEKLIMYKVRQVAAANAAVVFGVVSIAFMITALSGHGWWTYSTSVTTKIIPSCPATGSVYVELFPTGTEKTTSTKDCNGIKYGITTEAPFSTHNPDALNADQCASNGNAALGMTVVSVVIAAIGLAMHIAYSKHHVSFPLLMLIACGFAAGAFALFITKNPCVLQYKNAHLGAIGM